MNNSEEVRTRNAHTGRESIIPGFYPSRECPVCGGTFHVPDPLDWGYKARFNTGRAGRGKMQLVCSYHCMRTVEKGYTDNEDF